MCEARNVSAEWERWLRRRKIYLPKGVFWKNPSRSRWRKVQRWAAAVSPRPTPSAWFFHEVFFPISCQILSFSFFWCSPLLLSALAFYIADAFTIPTKASTKKKCFFIDKNTFFTCSQPSEVPSTCYDHERPYHYHTTITKKRKKQFIFYSLENTAPPEKAIRTGRATLTLTLNFCDLHIVNQLRHGKMWASSLLLI